MGYLDPIRDRAVIVAMNRAGLGFEPMVRSQICMRVILDPADRPRFEGAAIELMMRQLIGPGWGSGWEARQ